jgi:hypothetical protein
MPVIPAGRRLRQGDGEFKASLGYVARPCLNKNTNTKTKNKKKRDRTFSFCLHKAPSSTFPANLPGSRNPCSDFSPLKVFCLFVW